MKACSDRVLSITGRRCPGGGPGASPPRRPPPRGGDSPSIHCRRRRPPIRGLNGDTLRSRFLPWHGIRGYHHALPAPCEGGAERAGRGGRRTPFNERRKRQGRVMPHPGTDHGFYRGSSSGAGPATIPAFCPPFISPAAFCIITAKTAVPRRLIAPAA